MLAISTGLVTSYSHENLAQFLLAGRSSNCKKGFSTSATMTLFIMWNLSNIPHRSSSVVGERYNTSFKLILQMSWGIVNHSKLCCFFVKCKSIMVLKIVYVVFLIHLWSDFFDYFTRKLFANDTVVASIHLLVFFIMIWVDLNISHSDS